tara:strand:- start:1249 stop:1752 length:504 start_codon:yes stop_codon:yes gene_type:complete
MIDDLTKKLVEDAKNILEGNLDKVNPKAAAKKFDDRKDKDIDNDGDVDSSDEYLHKRRKAIGQAMKDEGNAFSAALMQAKKNGDKEFVVSGKKFQVKEVEELEKDKNKKDIKEIEKKKDVKEETLFEMDDTFIDMMNAMMKHKHGSKEFKKAKKEIEQYMSKKYKKK